jgi:hypothetical protein
LGHWRSVDYSHVYSISLATGSIPSHGATFSVILSWAYAMVSGHYHFGLTLFTAILGYLLARKRRPADVLSPPTSLNDSAIFAHHPTALDHRV